MEYGHITQLALSFAASSYVLLFAVAAYGKANSWAHWRRVSRGWVSGNAGRKALRMGLPLGETGVAVVILIDPRMGLFLSALALAFLGAGVVWLSRNHRGEECSCFGVASTDSIGPRLAVRNALLAGSALSLAILVKPERMLSLWPLVGTQALVLVLVVEVTEFLRIGDLIDSVRSSGGET